MFFLLPLILIIPMWIYLYFGFRRGLTLRLASSKWVTVLSVLGGGLLTLPCFGIFSGFGLWALAVMHLVVFLLLSQLANFIIRRCCRGVAPRKWDLVYRIGVIPVLCVVLLFTYGYFNMKNIVRTHYTVETAKEVPSEGYRVVLMADMHYGTSLDKEGLEDLVSRINQEKADVILLCGDLTDEQSTKEGLQELFSSLGKISSTYGTYFVYGNHDQSRYRADANYTTEDLEKAIANAGITILQDEVVFLTDSLVLAGRKDRSMERLTPEELLKGVDSPFVIMADHQPTEFELKEAAGVDLQLSGHTHGGQIFPVAYINTSISSNELCYGMEKQGDMTAIVTSGVSGWGFPLRTQGCSEYVVVDVVEE